MKERKLGKEARAILLTGLARGYFTYDELSRLPDMIGLEDVPVPGGGSFATASERSEHRWVWVGGERSSLGGAKDHERRKF